MQIFYRIHWSCCPTFCVENASSCPTRERLADGRRECPCCAGTCEVVGYDANGYDTDIACEYCEGSGAVNANRGYSCFCSITQLSEYLRDNRVSVCTDDSLIVFAGKIVGTGDDGEPLVIPSRWHKCSTTLMIVYKQS